MVKIAGGDWKRGVSSNLIIIGIDREMTVTAFNRKGEEITGFKRSEVLKRKAWETFLPNDHVDKWKDFINSSDEKYEKLPILTKDGKTLSIYWMLLHVKEDDKCLFGVEPGKERFLRGEKRKDKKRLFWIKGRRFANKRAILLNELMNLLSENQLLLEKGWSDLEIALKGLEKLANSVETERKALLKEKAKIEKIKIKTSEHLDKLIKTAGKKLRKKNVHRYAQRDDRMLKEELEELRMALDFRKREIEALKDLLSKYMKREEELFSLIDELKRDFNTSDSSDSLHLEDLSKIMDVPALVVKKGIIQAATPSFSELIGYEEKELRDKKIFSLMPADQLFKIRNHYLDRIRRKKDSNEYETVLLTKQKGHLHVKIETNPIKWKGEKAELMIIKEKVS